MFRLIAKNPTATYRLTYVGLGNTVNVGSWKEITSSLSGPCSAIEIFDSSGSALYVSTGSAGNEAANKIPFIIIPSGSAILLPIELKKGTRISVSPIDTNATSGQIIMNFFG